MNTFTKTYEEMDPAERAIFDSIVNAPVREPNFRNFKTYDSDEDFYNAMHNVTTESPEETATAVKAVKADKISELLKLDPEHMSINADGYIIWKKDRMLLRFRVSSKTVKIGVNAVAFEKIKDSFNIEYHEKWKVKYNVLNASAVDVFNALNAESAESAES